MSAAPHKKEALGKGIRSLLQHIDADLKSTAAAMPAEEKGLQPPPLNGFHSTRLK